MEEGFDGWRRENIFYQDKVISQFRMRSLDDFASEEGGKLFRDATSLPQFFSNNLVDPTRVVKVFENDPQANIRIFYYQYLKLCFQLETVDYEGYINKIEQILNNEGFKFIFFEDDDPSLFTDIQFKQLIMQFFGVLGQGSTTIESALSRYPIMDTVMVYFFRSILILTGRTDALDSYIDRDELIQYLCNYFGVEITFHDKCIKFVQTDIFVYEEDPKAVFMAYMDYDQANSSQANYPPTQDNTEVFVEEPSSQPSYQNSIPNMEIMPSKEPNTDYFNVPVSSSSRRGVNEVNNSYISSEFVDYTNGPVNLSGMVHQNNLKESGSIEGKREVVHSRKESEQVAAPTLGISPSLQEYQKTAKESIPSYSGDTFTYSSQTNSKSYGYSSLEKNEVIKTTDMGISTGVNYDKAGFKAGQNQFSWEPTKDPGFDKYSASNSTKSLSQYTKPPSLPNTTYQPPSPPNPTYKPPSPNIPPTCKPPSPQLPTYQPPAYTKPQSPVVTAYQPTPVYQNPSSIVDGFKKNNDKPSSYASSASESYKYVEKPPSMQIARPPAPTPTYTPNYQPSMAQGVATGKSVFGLNVSLEFTNSFTMKAMCEPYRTNVYNSRQRARNYRDSLKNYLK